MLLDICLQASATKTYVMLSKVKKKCFGTETGFLISLTLFQPIWTDEQLYIESWRQSKCWCSMPSSREKDTTSINCFYLINWTKTWSVCNLAKLAGILLSPGRHKIILIFCGKSYQAFDGITHAINVKRNKVLNSNIVFPSLCCFKLIRFNQTVFQ
jgi:hypothetical protein